MVSRKYTKDYRVEYELDSSGKPRPKTVYTGAWYVPVSPADELRAGAKRALLLTAGGWAACLLPLFPPSLAGHTAYVIFPHAMLPLPLYYMSAAAYAMLRCPARLNRREADGISHRFPSAALWLLILSCAALLGFTVRAVTGAELLRFPGDALFAVCEAALAGISICLFRMRPLARTVPQGTDAV